ncbi:olfactory receptor 52K1-like [Astyanax mexicanus]|uniref:Olfactory receptor 52K1-like n=1 Tax=Astyanax mexicanus TaxID=7994 RepID=A0A8T2L026_ASTMX|nr:olfactory receptor 52K1-like [Astyanax mexicanus]KAG9265070.1 olfactory receptor 52K1-like [Astyanax mexicanus]
MTEINMQDLTVKNISFTTFTLNGYHDLKEWRPILTIPYLLMFIFSSTSNSFLIFLIITQRALHSPMFVLIGLMAAGDLCWPIFIVPNMLFNFLFDWKQISRVGCLIQMFCVHFTGTFQSTLLLWMSLDRFCAICKPLSYHTYMQMPNFLKFVIVPVIRNIIIATAMVSWAGKLQFCMKNEINHCFCEHMAVVQLACGDISINNILGLLTLFFISGADFVLIAVSYVIIFSVVIKSGRSHSKALNTCVTHIIVISGTLVFALLSSLSYRIPNNFSPNSRIFLSTMYVLFPGCFNPIIYGLRTKEIREQLLKFINLGKVLPQ